MQKYEVQVQVMPSQGGELKRVPVDAVGEADAIVKATMKLDEEGIDRWSLKKVVTLTS